MRCHCGHEMKHEFKTATHLLFGKEISISDVPCWVCSSCGNAEYEFDTKVNHLLRDAYRAGQSTTQYC